MTATCHCYLAATIYISWNNEEPFVNLTCTSLFFCKFGPVTHQCMNWNVHTLTKEDDLKRSHHRCSCLDILVATMHTLQSIHEKDIDRGRNVWSPENYVGGERSPRRSVTRSGPQRHRSRQSSIMSATSFRVAELGGTPGRSTTRAVTRAAVTKKPLRK